MKTLLLTLMLLLSGVGIASAEYPFLPSAADEAHEVGIFLTLLGTASWAFRSWWKARLEDKQKIRVEQKLEKDWNGPDTTIPGSKNPGRTTAQLIEMVHESQKAMADDFREFQKETNSRFDKVHTDLGKLKGKIGID